MGRAGLDPGAALGLLTAPAPTRPPRLERHGMNALPDSPIDAAFLMRWLDAAATVIDREAAHLTELDSPIGDADHGSNMRRGFIAARTAVGQEPPDTPGGVLVAVGRHLISTVGGASGPLYGTLLRRAGKELGTEDAITAARLRDGLRAGTDAVAQLGGAAAGDKTMLDALLPALDAMTAVVDAGGSTAEVLGAGAAAADEGAAATIPLRARKGRASYLGERSIGHQDPGATSAALLVTALADTAREGAV